MTRPEQKEEERRVIEAYLRRRGLVGQLEAGPEPPDYVLRLTDQIIGIEVVTYHTQDRTVSGHTRREVGAAWEKIKSHVAARRETDRILDNLSVHLFFRELECPGTNEIELFVSAVCAEIEKVRAALTNRTTTVVINEKSGEILRRYLRKMQVRITNCYIEWEWNHQVGWVGASDQEMLSIIEPKMSYTPCPQFDNNWLIISGGGNISEVIGIWFPWQLEELREFNKALSLGPFDEVALFCVKSFLWTPQSGWTQI